MKRMVLNRLIKMADRTLGRLVVYDELKDIGHFYTLELPFKDNKRRESCILGGYYTVEPRQSKKYGKHLQVMLVPGRDGILFHHGNFPKDTTGCVLVGMDADDINADGMLEVVRSKEAMAALTELITEPTEILIL